MSVNTDIATIASKGTAEWRCSL